MVGKLLIAVLQDLLKDADDAKTLDKHPVDEKYESLGTKLTLLSSKSKELEIIETYVKSTAGRAVTLKDVWVVESSSLADKFKPFAKLGNHKLLWHGTNVAVVAAILSGGLRIMPHSGERTA
jgi:poly [ADP-ribose] polymerase 2/3/4